jgi:hypothetical protein
MTVHAVFFLHRQHTNISTRLRKPTSLVLFIFAECKWNQIARFGSRVVIFPKGLY